MRVGSRRTDVRFNFSEELITLVQATHCVEIRGSEAIHAAVHVIRNHNAWAVRLRLIQCALIPEVFDALHELPSSSKSAGVELRQADAARTFMLHFDKLPLH